MRKASAIATVNNAFWRGLEQVAQPDVQTRLHARGILRAMAESQNPCADQRMSAVRDVGGFGRVLFVLAAL